jgi:hypothetical protein
MNSKRWAIGTFGNFVLTAMLLSAPGVFADASCSIDCPSGKSAHCSCTGTGCDCNADSTGCVASCGSNGCNDADPCNPL